MNERCPNQDRCQHGKELRLNHRGECADCGHRMKTMVAFQHRPGKMLAMIQYEGSYPS